MSMSLDVQISQLESDIANEQMQYDIACEHPTQTDQYYRSLERQRQKLSGMKQKLSELKKRK